MMANKPERVLDRAPTFSLLFGGIGLEGKSLRLETKDSVHNVVCEA